MQPTPSPLDEREEVAAEPTQAQQIDWSDPAVLRYHAQLNRPYSVAEVRKNMVMYLKNQGGYKMNYFKGMKYEDIRPIFEKVWDQIQSFAPMDSEKEKDSEKKGSRKKSLARKRAGEKQSEESTKRQKIEDDVEKEELKAYLDLVPREEFAMEIESLATKYPIVDWKTHVLTENFMYYQIFRADGSSKNYKIFSEMLDDFDRQDVLDLHRLVKAKTYNWYQEAFRGTLRNKNTQKKNHIHNTPTSNLYKMSQPANDEFSQHLNDEESNHEDASDTGAAPKQQQQMEHYLKYIDNKVMEGNSVNGKLQEENFNWKGWYCSSTFTKHMRRFHGMDDAKEIWEAIRTRIFLKEVLLGFADEVIYSLFAKQSEEWDLLYEGMYSKGTHDGKKKRDSLYQHQEAGKQEKNQMGLLTMDDGIVNWGEHTEAEEINHALMAISSSEMNEKLKRYRRIGMKAVKEKEQLQKTLDSWKDSSKNLWRLIDSGMSSNSKVGLGFEIQSNNEVLSYEEEMNFSVFNCSKEDSSGKPVYSRFTKTNDFKGVPHPLSGDYTPKPQEEIDDSLYVYGKKGPQKPKISVSDDNSSEHSTCQSNNSEGSCGNTSEHSFETESESLSVPNEMSKSRLEVTNEKVVSELQEVEPSCAKHVKTPRQPLKDKETQKVNRKNWNE
ncbi:hypothetical protein Tco_0898555 [Tanacetum coccineum]